MAIPRILHQIYLQGWDRLPEATKESIDTLRSRNPGWEYRFYDDALAQAFISEKFDGDLLDQYRSIDPSYYSARADLLRYLVCYNEGGVYLDVKSSALRPLDDVLLPDDSYLLSHWPLGPDGTNVWGRHPELAAISRGEFVQWFIACSPSHDFLRAVIDQVRNNLKVYRFWRHGVGKAGC